MTLVDRMVQKLNIFSVGVVFLMSYYSVVGQSLVGLYAGYNESTFYNNYVSTSRQSVDLSTDPSEPSYVFGIYVKRRTSKTINLAVSLDYLKRNVSIDARYNARGGNIQRFVKSDIETINLKVLPEFRLGKKAAIYLNLGPYIGYIVSSTEQVDSGRTYLFMSGYTTWNEENKKSDQFKGYDIGLTASFGMEIPLFNNLIFLPDVTFSKGTNNLLKGSLYSFTGELNATNLYFTLGMAYKLRLFKSLGKKQKPL